MVIRPLPPKCNTKWFRSEGPPCNPNANQGCADCKVAVPDAIRCIAICLSSQARCNRARSSLYHCFEHSCDLQYLTRNLKREKQKFVYLFGERWTTEFKEGRLGREEIELGVRQKLKPAKFGYALKVVNNLIAYRTEIATDFYPRNTTGLSPPMKRTIEKKDASHRAVISLLGEVKDAIIELWQEERPATKSEKKQVTGMFALLGSDDEEDEEEEDEEEDGEEDGEAEAEAEDEEEEDGEDGEDDEEDDEEEEDDNEEEEQKQGPVPRGRQKGPKSRKYQQQIARYLSKLLTLGKTKPVFIA